MSYSFSYLCLHNRYCSRLQISLLKHHTSTHQAEPRYCFMKSAFRLVARVGVWSEGFSPNQASLTYLGTTRAQTSSRVSAAQPKC